MEQTTTREEYEAIRRVREGYRTMLLYYRRTGIGERSQYAGCIIRQNLIDTIERRFLQLGGRLRDV